MLNFKDPTDILYLSPDLTPEDKSMFKSFYETNAGKAKKNKNKIFSSFEEEELAQRLDQIIKTLIIHKIKIRKIKG